MKSPIFSLPALCAAMALSGCDKEPSARQSPTPEPKPAASTPAAPNVTEAAVNADADKLMQSILSAGPEEQSRAGKATQAIRAGNYGAAQDILKRLLAEGHLTPEQKELVTGLMPQLQTLKQQKR